VQLTDGTNTVDLERELAVDWGLGQPNYTTRPVPSNDLPYVLQKNKAAFEEFRLNWEYTESAASKINTLVNDLIGPPLERGSLTLNFNGIYGLGSFDVAPPGSSPLRHQRRAAETGVAVVPSLRLRRVLSQ